MCTCNKLHESKPTNTNNYKWENLNKMDESFKCQHPGCDLYYTFTCPLLTGLHSEKCIVKHIRHCTNITVSCTNLDGVVYYTPRLYGTTYC